MNILQRSILVVGTLLVGGCLADQTNPIVNRLDARIRWVTEIRSPIYYGSPALSNDGLTAYVGTSFAPANAVPHQHALVALDVATGAERWRYSLSAAEVRSTPAVAPDGSITLLAEEKSPTGGFVSAAVVRVSAAGALVWRRELGIGASAVDIGFSAPAIGTDGSVYIATDSLYALNPNGTVRWTRFFTGEEIRSSAAIGSDGTIYFASRNIPLTAMHPDSGRVLWELPLGAQGHVFAAPAIGTDGAIYVATDECVLYAVSAAGTSLWSYNAGTSGSSCTMRSSPAVGADGTIYLGTSDRNPRPVLFAIRPNGQLRWTYTPSGMPIDVAATSFDIYSSPVIGSDGAVYFGQEFGRVYAVDAQAGSERWVVRVLGSIVWSSPALTLGGVLVVSDVEGRVYAITTESAGLQGTSPWPRYRGGNRSAGRR
jgi:outer membrane protein assembly factor BamB